MHAAEELLLDVDVAAAAQAGDERERTRQISVDRLEELGRGQAGTLLSKQRDVGPQGGGARTDDCQSWLTARRRSAGVGLSSR
jgi:hypothetical protein